MPHDVPPLASGVPYLEWWMSTAGHVAVTEQEMQEWLKQIEDEQKRRQEKLKRTGRRNGRIQLSDR